LLTLLGCALSTSVQAEHHAPSEAAFLGELPMVLSASRLSQPLSEAPGAMTVIDRDMIRLSGARTVADLMRLVPGMQVGSRSGYYPLATYHGLSDDTPRRMLVRIDGRSTYAPYLISGTEWHTITVDLEDIERIEVFRGTNASAYGSQAFMGVVNIVTRAATDSPRLRARINQGENGIRDRNVSIGQRFGSHRRTPERRPRRRQRHSGTS
jgi:iron complex outermembrane recepter protein